jgi:prepilin-type N-terminal cleavage/methylation domain-containing protein
MSGDWNSTLTPRPPLPPAGEGGKEGGRPPLPPAKERARPPLPPAKERARYPLSKSGGGVKRDGFSILELMIALGLLSVLMLVGWGMMDSLERSQERSWKLSQRIRVLRLTRSWLSEDLDHLARGESFGSNPNDIGSAPVSFEGDINGFTATILPSLDPVLFLQRLGDDRMENSVGFSGSSEVTLESLAATPEEMATQEWKESIWSGDKIDVEYRLEPIYDEASVLAEIQDPETVQYEIVRREWIPEAYFDQFRSTNEPLGGVQSPRAQRKGSAANGLASGSLEAMAAEETEWIPPLKETRLYGVIKPKFQYFDGSQWLDDWSSQVQGGLPRAVAITFDFPPISEFKKPPPPPDDSDIEDIADLSMEFDNPLFEAQANSVERLSQVGGMDQRLVESSESEYVLIVETGQRDGVPAAMFDPSAFSPSGIGGPTR